MHILDLYWYIFRKDCGVTLPRGCVPLPDIVWCTDPVTEASTLPLVEGSATNTTTTFGHLTYGIRWTQCILPVLMKRILIACTSIGILLSIRSYSWTTHSQIMFPFLTLSLRVLFDISAIKELLTEILGMVTSGNVKNNFSASIIFTQFQNKEWKSIFTLLSPHDAQKLKLKIFILVFFLSPYNSS